MYLNPADEKVWSLLAPAPKGYARSRPVTGVEQIPLLRGIRQGSSPNEIVAFDDVGRATNSRLAAAHFYKSDDKFIKYLYEPSLLVQRLSQFGYVLTPDISLSPTMGRWQKVGLTVLSRQVGSIWEDHGLNVIPSLRWVEVDDCDFVFEGVPKQTSVAVSSYGLISDSLLRENFTAGLVKLLTELQPSSVFIYGSVNEEIRNLETFPGQFQFFKPKHWQVGTCKVPGSEPSLF